MPLLFNGNEPSNIKYNGNDVSKVIYNGVTVWQKSGDTTPPTITVKTGANETIGDFENKIFSKISFKLYDNVGLKEYEVNGVITKITLSQWSDLNGIRIGRYNGVEGYNKLVIRDTSNNESVYEFTLVP